MLDRAVCCGAQPSTSTIARPAVSIISRKVSAVEPGLFSCSTINTRGRKNRADRGEELAGKAPAFVVCPQMEGSVIEKWRVADDQIPLLLGGDSREIV